jgi:hypothetical protein
MDIETERQIARAKFALADHLLAKREREAREAARALRASRPCNATNKNGKPCARRAYANGFCGGHGGLNRGQVKLQRFLEEGRARRAAREAT